MMKIKKLIIININFFYSKISYLISKIKEFIRISNNPAITNKLWTLN